MTYIISLKPLNNPSQIHTAIIKAGITGPYVYAFVVNSNKTILKFGLSKNTGNYLGNRIYRQACWIPGWPVYPYPPSSCSGASMQKILGNYKKIYNYSLTKDDIDIYIWITNNPQQLERQLIDEHIEKTGQPPIGNKDSVTRKKIVENENKNQLEKAGLTFEK